jgi:hypothetical protein
MNAAEKSGFKYVDGGARPLDPATPARGVTGGESAGDLWEEWVALERLLAKPAFTQEVNGWHWEIAVGGIDGARQFIERLHINITTPSGYALDWEINYYRHNFDATMDAAMYIGGVEASSLKSRIIEPEDDPWFVDPVELLRQIDSQGVAETAISIIKHFSVWPSRVLDEAISVARGKVRPE